ncbi:TonB family protein [Sphingomonas sp. PB4P5]|uniref:TonB family protein n=1 Tax=Parasphingomonas puruogangriensis TaxID=3096155 RepID=UPI002FC74844
MRLPFRVGVPAIASLLVNAAMLAALFTLGVKQEARPTRRAPAVMALAMVKGAEDGAEDAPSAAPTVPSETPPAPAAPTAPVAPPTMPAPALPKVASAPVAATVAAEVMPAASMPAAAAAVAASSLAAAPSTAAMATRRGARDGLDANAPPGTSRSYAAKVRSWLLAHKTYPRHARMRREEGMVRVRFVIDRAGRLLEGAIIARCGLAALDEEAAAMLRRAAPYPAAPSDMPGERFEITAPIEFVLPV